jgi:hypothetical protein
MRHDHGMDWGDKKDITTVLLRHFPELTPVLMRTKNAFAPWESARSPATP